MHSFFKGLLLGIAIAAPVGPISILCIRRSLTRGFVAGFATGIGAAIADGIYGLIASLGLTAISDFLIKQQNLLKFLAGVFLIFIGSKIFLRPELPESASIKSKKILPTVLETLLLTLANPFTIVSFTAIFASLAIEFKSYTNTLITTFGIMLGSTLWFFSVSLILSLCRKKCSPNVIIWIQKFSGILLICFGSIALISLFYK